MLIRMWEETNGFVLVLLPPPQIECPSSQRESKHLFIILYNPHHLKKKKKPRFEVMLIFNFNKKNVHFLHQ